MHQRGPRAQILHRQIADPVVVADGTNIPMHLLQRLLPGDLVCHDPRLERGGLGDSGAYHRLKLLHTIIQHALVQRHGADKRYCDHRGGGHAKQQRHLGAKPQATQKFMT